MARTRGNAGPPGLGGIPNGENPTPEPEIPPSDREEHIVWYGPRAPLPEEEIHTPPSDALSEKLETLWSEFTDQNAVIEQLNGQLRTMEQTEGLLRGTAETHHNALINLNARLDALAKQTLQINVRATALQLAVQAKGVHEPSSKIVEQAERFYQFLLKDMIAREPSPEEMIVIPSVGPDSTTQH